MLINIKSKFSAENGNETIEFFTKGKLEKNTHSRNESDYRLTYVECEDNGYAGSLVTLGITGNDLVTLNRDASEAFSPTNIVIERGKKHYCHYGTPYGDFMVGISANEIMSDMNDFGGNLRLKYTVDINSSFMSRNEMEIEVRPEN